MSRYAIKMGLVCLLLMLSLVGLAGAVDVRIVPLTQEQASQLAELRASDTTVQCALSYYYLIEGCSYVGIIGGIDANETYGVHFNMMDVVAWSTPCDTAACIKLDTIELVLYDVLEAPADQSMNVKVYGADQNGDPTGDLLGNRDFAPVYTGSGTFTTVVIDFTNGGTVQGLDLSSCHGNFVVLLTWKNSTGHPQLVLDVISACVDHCPGTPACCQMGTTPYIYPRTTAHTAYYGTEPNWTNQGSIYDSADPTAYGRLEAFWKTSFCKWSAVTEPTTWGAIKATYK